jgi:hypothetical protein
VENDANDQKVIDLLSKLKDDNNVYPFDLLESRRQKYLQRAAQIGLGIGTGAGLKNTLKGRRPGLPPTAGTWLEAALVVAIVAEAGAAAYFYRHKLADLLETVIAAPGVQEVTPPPAIPSSLPVTEISVVPTLTVTGTPTATGTPIPVVTDGTNSNGNTPGGNDMNNNANEGNNPAASTPEPNGNNGNHFGQTKQPPKATKEPKDAKVPNDEGSRTRIPKNK